MPYITGAQQIGGEWFGNVDGEWGRLKRSPLLAGLGIEGGSPSYPGYYEEPSAATRPQYEEPWYPGERYPEDEKPWYDRILPGDQDTPADLLPGWLEPDPGDEGIVPWVDPLMPGDQDQPKDFQINPEDLNPFSEEFGWFNNDPDGDGKDEDSGAVFDIKALLPFLALGLVGGAGFGAGTYSERRRSRRRRRR